MNKIFEQVGISPNVSRSSFDQGHENKLTFNYGELIPTFCYQLLPGDSGKVSVESLLRQQTMIAPVMQRSNVSHHWFKVPMRLLDRNFRQKRTRWNNATNATYDILAPYLSLKQLARLFVKPSFFSSVDFLTSDFHVLPTSPAWDSESLATAVAQQESQGYYSYLSYSGTLMDYLGVPCGPHYQFGVNVTPSLYYCQILLDTSSTSYGGRVSLYPILAYNLIYATWYRDQNLEVDWLHNIIEEISSSSAINPDVNIFAQPNQGYPRVRLLKTQFRAYSKDYFTSMLPRTLKSTEFPNGISAPVVSNGVSIEGLRIANALQNWLERDSRGGTRYPEWLMSHFGVSSSYGLLDYPEFLGGFTSPLSVSDVTQQSASNDVSPQGNVAGVSVNYDSSRNLSYYSEEDGYLICITSVLPKQGYSQGLSRSLSRLDFVDDYYMPEFANLGEQAVKRKDLQVTFGDIAVIAKNVYTDGSVTVGYIDSPNQGDLHIYYTSPDESPNEDTIGYQSRYADWKYSPDEIHGEFRNNLDYWHMSRIFPYITTDTEDVAEYIKKYHGSELQATQLIQLNNSFIKCKPSDVDRVFAIRHDVSSQIKMQIYFSHYAVRRMPEFPVPRL